jgi:hypothetical protein
VDGLSDVTQALACWIREGGSLDRDVFKQFLDNPDNYIGELVGAIDTFGFKESETNEPKERFNKILLAVAKRAYKTGIPTRPPQSR